MTPICCVHLVPSRALLSGAILAAGAVPVIDITRHETADVPDGAWVRTRPGRPAPGTGPVILAELGAAVTGRETWLETSVPRAVPRGFAGIVLKGREAGGTCGDDDGLTLLASCPDPSRVLLWAGVGPRTAAAAAAMGARGVVLVGQHLALPELDLPSGLRQWLGKEEDELTTPVAGFRVGNPPTSVVLRSLASGDNPFLLPDAWEVGLTLGIWEVGQGLSLALGLAGRYRTLGGLLEAYLFAMQSPGTLAGSSRVVAAARPVHTVAALREENTAASSGQGLGSGPLWEVASWMDRPVHGEPLLAAVATGCAVVCEPSAHAQAVSALTPHAPDVSNVQLTVKAPCGAIAIIGLGCRFPDAPDIGAYWENIVAGRNSIREVPADRWDSALYFDEDKDVADRTYSRIGGFITDFKFRSKDFRIPPAVAKQLDPVQQMTLAAVRDALIDAGLKADKRSGGADFDRSRCGVILGNSLGGEITDDYTIRLAWPRVRAKLADSEPFLSMASAQREEQLSELESSYKAGLPVVNEDSMPGELSNVIAGRVANAFDLGGANFTVDAACASSMAAMDNAVKSLRSGDTDLVITGGADRSMGVPTYVKFCKIGALSPDHSAPFDASANGFVMGEGCGILVLERLEDAVANGHRVYAVIDGIGASSDGKGKGITAPNPRGQILALERAYEAAGVNPNQVDLVECHGTSTVVGDMVEVTCLSKVVGTRPAERGPLRIGSVKSMIGHLKSAAGAAACIKAALAVHHGIYPPSINCNTPRGDLPLDVVPMRVQDRAEPWVAPADGVRRCGVSAFGFGGTNFHVVMSSAGPRPAALAAVPVMPTPVAASLVEPAPASAIPSSAGVPKGVWAVSASSEAELSQRLTGLLRGVAQPFSASDAVRVAAAAESQDEQRGQVERVLKSLAKGSNPDLLRARGVHLETSVLSGQVAFLFTGQGSQYLNMGLDLAERYPVVADTFAEADQVLAPMLGQPVSALIRWGGGNDKSARQELLKRTEFSQPATLTVDIAIARLLASYGVLPDVVAGHSLGEYAACVMAGILTFPKALEAVSARGREMASIRLADPGKMAGVATATDVVEEVLAEIDGYVVPANKNCPSQTVIAGASDAVDAAMEAFRARGISCQLLPVSHAFHSRIVAPASEPLRMVLRRLELQSPVRPITTNVNAERYPADPEAIVDLLARQIASPVEWVAQIERMYAEGVRAFVECGPKRALTGFAVSILKRRPHRAWATNHPKRGGIASFHNSLAGLLAAGVELRAVPSVGPVDLLALPARAAALEDDLVPAVAATSRPLLADDAVQQFLQAAAAGSEELDAERFATSVLPAVQQLLTVAFQSVQSSRTPAKVTASSGGEPSTAVPSVSAPIRATRAPGVQPSDVDVVCSGASVGLPGGEEVFGNDNFARILGGDNRIEHIGERVRDFMELELVRLVKDSQTGRGSFLPVTDEEQVIRLAGRKAEFSASEFGIPDDLARALDITTKLAVASGLIALDDAGIPLVQTFRTSQSGKQVPAGWRLPEAMRDRTGVVFASAFPGYDSLIRHLKANGDDGEGRFDRRFLFQVLNMAHAQFAQFIGARGPNSSVNAACASTTQAMSVAEDWIRMGRCDHVVLLSADDVTSDNMLKWIGGGFMAAGAATTADKVEEAALPFDARRHGMILGMGAAAFVVERGEKAKERGVVPIARLLGTQIANSAFHGTRLDPEHISRTVTGLMERVSSRVGMSLQQMAPQTMFMSHETYTPARGGSAQAEIDSIRAAFGPAASKVVVANTKGFTGHAMGAGIEDAVVLKALQYRWVPPIANLKQPDEALGDILLSSGGPRDVRFGLRFAAGFGSQLALAFWEGIAQGDHRTDHDVRQRWLREVCGSATVCEERVHRTRRVLPADVDTFLDVGVGVAPTAVVEAPVHTPAPAPVPNDVEPPVVAKLPVVAASSDVLTDLLGIVAEKTGYEISDLEPDFELEADLGIDTVKQAEILADVQTHFGIGKDDDFRLSEYPTIEGLAAYVVGQLDDVSVAEPDPILDDETLVVSAHPPVRAAAPPSVVSTPRVERRPNDIDAPVRPSWGGPMPLDTLEIPVAASVAAPVADDTYDVLADVVADLSGYGIEDLEPDFELEADLGIDTVKQAEILAAVQKRFGMDRDEDFRLGDHPTLEMLAAYLSERRMIVAEQLSDEDDTVVDSADLVDAFDAPAPSLLQMQAIGPAMSTDAATYGDPISVPLPSTFRIRRPILVDQSLVSRQRLSEQRVLVLGSSDLARAMRAELDARNISLAGPYSSVVDLADDVMASFATVQELNVGRPSRWITVTRLGGLATTTSMARAFVDGARGGLTKALGREWPEVAATVLDVTPDAASGHVVKWVCEELEATGPDEVFRSEHRRRVVMYRTEAAPPPAALPDQVVLITGGGRGVGARVALEIARRGPVKLALVGRGPAGATPLDVETEKRSIRSDLQDEEVRVTPAQIERRLGPKRKAEQIRATIASLREAGASVQYFRRDVSNPSDVTALVAEVQRAFGPIGLVIHGAGVEESRLIGDKDASGFHRVFDGKAMGGRELMELLWSGTRFVSMGSVAGRFGNAGQVDYAAANEALARMCLMRPGSLHIDWTAWDDVGMAVRGGMKSLLERRGVDLLPADAGAALTVDLIAAGAGGELVVAGRLGDFQPPAPHPLLDRMELDGDIARGFRLLSLDSDPWIEDHTIERNPVLPGVIGIELMAAMAGVVASGQAVVGADSVQFAAPCKIYRDDPTLLVIEAEPEQPGRVAVTLSSERTLATGRVNRVEHFRAIFWLGFAPDVGSLPSAFLPDESVTANEIYERFFHGPRFQVMTRVTGVSADGLLAEGVVDDRAVTPMTVTEPLALELGFQSAGLHQMMAEAQLALPASVDELRLMGPARPEDILSVAVRLREDGAYDIDVDGNAPVLRVRGYRMSTMGPLGPKERFPEPPGGRPVCFPVPGTRRTDAGQVAQATFEDAEKWPSGEEIEALTQRGNMKRARDRLAGRSAAKRAVHLLTGVGASDIRIESRASGEPVARLKNHPDVFVSLSHREGYAIAFASHERVGIDLEAVEERPPSFVAAWYSEAEQVVVGDDDLRITIAWSVKEAVLKYLGVGLSLSPHDVQVVAIGGDTADVSLQGRAAERHQKVGGKVLSIRWQRESTGDVVVTVEPISQAA
jgi:acyl transferase domain-containing protein/NAD(P)-dependent dehydrogenase (short-subunit alcohol dehydrogenase family)/phosphopantetheinyl transferase/acyl carrier protein